MDVEGCGRLSVHDGSFVVAWFGCASWGVLVAGEVNVSYAVVKCGCAGRQKSLCGSYVT